MKNSIHISALLGFALLTGCGEEAPHPGQAIYDGTCKVCHGTGLAGAPVVGNQKAWAARIARGEESMYGHAINGWGDMPARGGNQSLSDDEVKSAVDYMVSLSK